MDLKTQLNEALADAVSELFTSILSLVPAVEELTGSQDDNSSKEIASIVGFAGVLEGSITLLFSKAMACKIVSKMLGMELNEMSQDVRDGVGEVANILVGGLKSRVAPMGYQFEISIPSVIEAANPLNIVQLKETELIKLKVGCPEVAFLVDLSYMVKKTELGAKIEPKPEDKAKVKNAEDVLKNIMKQ